MCCCPILGGANAAIEDVPQVALGQFTDHVRCSIKAFLSSVLGRSEVLGDCSHALNAGGEGGLLHTGVLGSYSGAVVAGDYSLMDHTVREDRVSGYGNGCLGFHNIAIHFRNRFGGFLK